MTNLLKIYCIKQIFEGLTETEQNSLVMDLMNIANIHSISYINRPRFLDNIEIDAPKNETPKDKQMRLRKSFFIEWLTGELTSLLVIITKKEIETAYELFQFFELNSYYPDYPYDGGEYDTFISAKDKNTDDTIELLFQNFTLFIEFEDFLNIKIQFTEILFIIHNGGDLDVLLTLFGYKTPNKMEKLPDEFIDFRTNRETRAKLANKFIGLEFFE